MFLVFWFCVVSVIAFLIYNARTPTLSASDDSESRSLLLPCSLMFSTCMNGTSMLARTF
ncbi:hypothetical protein CPB83DRAFT_855036 [Crepidotus variabilis]|uniref:Uncharacterized protein n=1 Tax=Crepidotus variabilis TaxID=179855 RepID=A0A9P6EFX7_9AGAR|nr:hypothetical protein CPB83DRAFT_855036 [Crepidotus variabilis]